MGREITLTEAQQDALTTARCAGRQSADAGWLVVVRGASGSGKTTLLEVAARRWRSEGMRVVHVGFRASVDRWGVDSITDALRADFGQLSDAGLIEGIGSLIRLRKREAESPRWRPLVVVTEMGRVFGRIGETGPTAILLDDVLGLADPALLLVAARRPGCLVVTTVPDDVASDSAAAEVVASADEVIDLQPLADAEIGTVVGDEVAEETRLALRTALGPLCGNPGTVLATVAMLRARGRLVSVDGQLHLTDSRSAIPLPEDHELIRRARAMGDLAVRLLAVAAIVGGVDIDDLPSIARSLGGDAAECGRALDLLVEAGLLVGDVRGHWVCRCPALAAAATREVRGGASTVSTKPEAAGEPKWIGRPGKAGLIRGRREVWSAAEGAVTVDRQPLSVTEGRIVDLISRGWTNRRIAAEIGVQEKTVERYLTRLFAKLGCRSRVELVSASLAGPRAMLSAGSAIGRDHTDVARGSR